PFLLLLPPPLPRPTLFPYTTLFRSCGHPQPGRRHRSRHAHSHRYVVCQHALAEEVARLPEPRSVIRVECFVDQVNDGHVRIDGGDRKSTRLNSSHEWISYAVFCLKK